MPEASSEYRCVSQLITQAKPFRRRCRVWYLSAGFSRLENKVFSDLSAMLSDLRLWTILKFHGRAGSEKPPIPK
jgi:hypothetical protein